MDEAYLEKEYTGTNNNGTRCDIDKKFTGHKESKNKEYRLVKNGR
jgi:hypothetical protein